MMVHLMSWETRARHDTRHLDIQQDRCEELKRWSNGVDTLKDKTLLAIVAAHNHYDGFFSCHYKLIQKDSRTKGSRIQRNEVNIGLRNSRPISESIHRCILLCRHQIENLHSQETMTRTWITMRPSLTTSLQKLRKRWLGNRWPSQSFLWYYGSIDRSVAIMPIYT